MAVAEFISALREHASATVLTNPESEEFKGRLLRWSDLGIEVPRAIVCLKSEEEVLCAVYVF